MDISDRMFEPPAPDLAKINARLQALPFSLADLVRRAGDALATGDLEAAQSILAQALARAAGQPDVLRLYGLLLARVGNLPAARANFEASLRVAPDDALVYYQYAQVCEEAGDVATAGRLRGAAVQRLPDSPMALFDLGDHLERYHEPEKALPYLQRAATLAPGYAPALLKSGDALVACGRTEEAAVAIRAALAIEPAFGAAWLALVDIKTAPITDDEAERMRALLCSQDIAEGERTAIAYALARVQEQRGSHVEAYRLLLTANTRRKREIASWDEERFLSRARRVEEVFAMPRPPAEDPHLGCEAIFIVGLPRSGTTLIEQIVASHPEVQGLGERGELAQVLTEESALRREQFPEWVPAATARDWHRLGRRYFDLLALHRDGRSRFTDKMPNNWQALGAIRAMLPAARVVICRRDPLENCWSCYRQYFAHGWEFTCDFHQLAAFWKAFDRAASWWARNDREHVREQRYETLTEDLETEVRALLEFCALPFDRACLSPHLSRRAVHTLSAAQVRLPVYGHSGTAAAYGVLLDPLRNALGLSTGNSAAG